MNDDGTMHIWQGNFIDLGGAFTNFALSPIPMLLLALVLVMGFVNFVVRVAQTRRDGTYDEDKLPGVLATNVWLKAAPLLALGVGAHAYTLFVPLMALLLLVLFFGYGLVVLYVELRQLARRVEFEPRIAAAAVPKGPPA